MDKQEFIGVYREHARRLYNFILWTTGNKASSDDILQNVFVKVWNHGILPRDEEEQRKVMFTIARNACRDHFRSASRFSQLCSKYSSEPTLQHNDYEQKQAGISWQLVSSLPETERCILYLHLKIGYTYGEIASMMQLTEVNIRVKICRALKQLREVLKKADE